MPSHSHGSSDATALHSFNTEVENKVITDLDVDVDDSFNTDNSVDSHDLDLDVDVDDSFNRDSHDVDVDDSFNTDDSYNTTWVTKTDDHSISAGNREYNTGFGDVTVGGLAAATAAAAGGGDTTIFLDGRSTITDSSVNQNVAGFHVDQRFDSRAVTASGDDSVAAGDDVRIDTDLDESMNINAHGDVNLGNDTTINTTLGSFNTHEDYSTETDNSIDVDINHSLNDYSDHYSADDSFNTDVDYDADTDVDVDVDAIVNSHGAAIADDIDF